MIQRIQTVWLLLASLLSVSLMMDWYTGYVYKADLAQGLGAVVSNLRVTNYFPSLLLAAAMIIMPLIAIFFFKDRKKQRSISWLGILISIAFIAINLMHIEDFKNNTTPTPQNGTYQLGMVVPVIVIVFIFLAINSIKKDDKLVKSMDRLR